MFRLGIYPESKWIRTFRNLVLATSITTMIVGIIISLQKWRMNESILELIMYFVGHLGIAIILLIIGMVWCEFFNNIDIIAKNMYHEK